MLTVWWPRHAWRAGQGIIESAAGRESGDWWWVRQGLNLRPFACEANALPLSYAPFIELKNYYDILISGVPGSNRCKLFASSLEGWRSTTELTPHISLIYTHKTAVSIIS